MPKYQGRMLALFILSSSLLMARGPNNYDRKVDTNYFKSRKQQCPPPRPVPCEEIPVFESDEIPFAEENVEVIDSALTIQEIYGGGELIQLDNGSLWQIPPSERSVISTWAKNDQVEVLQSSDKAFPFRLTNCTNRKTVKAFLKAAPAR